MDQVTTPAESSVTESELPAVRRLGNQLLACDLQVMHQRTQQGCAGRRDKVNQVGDEDAKLRLLVGKKFS